MITSTSNASVKHIINLVKKGKARKEEDVFVVDGKKMLSELPRDRFVKGFATEDFLRENREGCLKDLPMEVVAPHVMEAMSDTRTPQGALAVVRQYHYSRDDLKKEEMPLYLLLERLSDPGNLGTILRVGEGAGLTGIFLSRDCVDIYNPKVIRATMGSIYRVPFLYVDSLKDTARQLMEEGVFCAAAYLEGSLDYHKADYRRPAAFYIGNEAAGLSSELAELSHQKVRIPMLGKVESLNAAVAAAILMYEAFRQRR